MKEEPSSSLLNLATEISQHIMKLKRKETKYKKIYFIHYYNFSFTPAYWLFSLCLTSKNVNNLFKNFSQASILVDLIRINRTILSAKLLHFETVVVLFFRAHFTVWFSFQEPNSRKTQLELSR